MLKVKISTAKPENCKDDFLVVGVFEPEKKDGKVNLDDALSPLAEHINQAIDRHDFAPSFRRAYSLPYPAGLSVKRLLMLGLGKQSDYNRVRLERAIAAAASICKNHVGDSASFTLAGLDFGDVTEPTAARAVVEAAALQTHTDERFKSGKKDKKDAAEKKRRQLNNLTLLAKSNNAALKAEVARAEATVAGVLLARELVICPANMLNPTDFANEAKKLSAPPTVKVKVLNEGAIRRLKMGAFLSVSAGSETPPTLSIIEYNMAKKNLPLIALVGKGVTFDTGGISIKPSGGMHEMKGDMAGAAVVMATLSAVAKMKLPLRVVGVMPATENMPSGKATRPGDVVTAYNGLTIEVLNTDAEGRMILADALAYTQKQYNPDAMINLATLTGAVVVALGVECCAVLGNNTELSDLIVEAGERVGERAWPMPMWDEYGEGIKSSVADIQNIGRGREAGTVIGGKFLEHFVEKKTPWCHLDIAGPGWLPRARPMYPAGASGYGVRLLLGVLENWQPLKSAKKKSRKKK